MCWKRYGRKCLGLLCHSFGPGEFIFLGGGKGYAGALTRLSTRHLLTQNQQKNAAEKRRCIYTVKIGALHNYGNYCTTSSLFVKKHKTRHRNLSHTYIEMSCTKMLLTQDTCCSIFASIPVSCGGAGDRSLPPGRQECRWRRRPA